MSSCVIPDVPSNNEIVPKNTSCCTRFSFDSCLLAVKNNHLNCLQKAHMAGCPLGKIVVKTAKQLQHIDCWLYAKSNINTNL